MAVGADPESGKGPAVRGLGFGVEFRHAGSVDFPVRIMDSHSGLGHAGIPDERQQVFDAGGLEELPGQWLGLGEKRRFVPWAFRWSSRIGQGRGGFDDLRIRRWGGGLLPAEHGHQHSGHDQHKHRPPADEHPKHLSLCLADRMRRMARRTVPRVALRLVGLFLATALVVRARGRTGC